MDLLFKIMRAISGWGTPSAIKRFKSGRARLASRSRLSVVFWVLTSGAVWVWVALSMMRVVRRASSWLINLGVRSGEVSCCLVRLVCWVSQEIMLSGMKWLFWISPATWLKKFLAISSCCGGVAPLGIEGGLRRLTILRSGEFLWGMIFWRKLGRAMGVV